MSAVLAAIAASDALCGRALGHHASGDDHRAAPALLKTLTPDGARLSAKLGRLLSDKSILQYGTYCTRATAERAVKDAQTLIEALDERAL